MKTKLIAGIKRGSPYTGLIKKTFSPAELAQQYDQLGASVISITTAPEYFGKKEWITEVKNVTKLPVFRKDFITNSDDIKESADLGVNWLALLAGAHTPEKLNDLVFETFSRNMRPIVVMSNIAEIPIAAKSECNSVLINNPVNEITKRIDLTTTNLILPVLPDQLEISVSGGLETNWQFVKALITVQLLDFIGFDDLLMTSTNLTKTFDTIFAALVQPTKTLINLNN